MFPRVLGNSWDTITIRNDFQLRYAMYTITVNSTAYTTYATHDYDIDII